VGNAALGTKTQGRRATHTSRGDAEAQRKSEFGSRCAGETLKPENIIIAPRRQGAKKTKTMNYAALRAEKQKTCCFGKFWV
jgi:hypothetical protein